ncbi:cyclophilin-like fold protein [Arthrobacter sp. 135MFCol5.1]|uniref:cyclophilin-like fold protein n=1 Tax=Arthrobacter sp. 135MFCol5.1 TaxID=1158050 RepID=UPI00037BD390|nr:cyclophilin-like fold protein [Arthrobacter sp. 135MFCol5.1]
MRLPTTAGGAVIASALLLSGCGAAQPAERPSPTQTKDASPGRSVEPTGAPFSAPHSPGASQSPPADQGVAGTVVHFSGGNTVVKVVIDEDNPTTRSFLAMLPMTLAFSDYGSKEKVATPTGEWDFTNAEGLDPQVGDLFSYKPWRNLGFFYNTDGNAFLNDLVRVGKTADIDQIKLLDGQQVTITVAG